MSSEGGLGDFDEEPLETSATGGSRKIKNKSLGTSSSSDRARVIEELRKYGPVDDEAVDELINLCRKSSPDLCVEEMVEMIPKKLSGVQIKRSVMGFLLGSLPKCFKGESFAQFRRERQLALESEHQRNLKAARAFLDDPESCEEHRIWARQVLKDQ
jgi:hypothetical protein